MRIRKQSFTHQSFVDEYSKNNKDLQDDLTKTLTVEDKEQYEITFAGDKDRANLFHNLHRDTFLETWKNNVMAYTQGDIAGESLSNLLWQNVFIQKGRIEESTTVLGFGYLNDRGEKCGLFIKYLNNDPTCWIISVARNFDNPDPTKRTIDLFSSNDMFLPADKKPEKPLTAADAAKEIIKTINCKKISLLLKRNLISTDGAISESDTERLRINTTHGKAEILNKIKARIQVYSNELKAEGLKLFSKAPIKKQAAEKFLAVLQEKNQDLFSPKELEALSDGQLGKLIEPYIDALPEQQKQQFHKDKERKKDAQAVAHRLRH